MKISDKNEQSCGDIVTPFSSSNAKRFQKLSENSLKIDTFHNYISNVTQIVLLDFEPDYWTLRTGVNSLIGSIPCTKQLKLFIHVLRKETFLRASFGTVQCPLMKCLVMEENC